jgi:hypothetical protein
MADDGAPKSAFELAMERLRKKDAAEGVTTRKLTDEEKAAIAEVDRRFRREKERLASERDAKVEKIRAGKG